MDWSHLIGKSIKAFRGYRGKTGRFGKKITGLDFILFDDGETYLALEEQSKYDYHDCSSSARDLHLYKDSVRWEELLSNDFYCEPDNLANPF